MFFSVDGARIAMLHGLIYSGMGGKSSSRTLDMKKPVNRPEHQSQRSAIMKKTLADLR